MFTVIPHLLLGTYFRSEGIVLYCDSTLITRYIYFRSEGIVLYCDSTLITRYIYFRSEGIVLYCDSTLLPYRCTSVHLLPFRGYRALL